jgi:PTH1 family peptidyl-tRNA hydrolase
LHVIVGLGNPGPAYVQTRHNVGFMAVDAMASAAAVRFRRHGLSLRAHHLLAGHEVILAKPQTFMNRSGAALLELMSDFRLDVTVLQTLIVVHDDLDLPVGRIRLKTRGGHGGHQGVNSIIDTLGTDRFARLKIGVGRPPDGLDPAEYVLTPWSADRNELRSTLERAIEALQCWVAEGITTAMNQFNRAPIE